MYRRTGHRNRVYNGYGNDLFVHVPKYKPKSYESRPIYRTNTISYTTDIRKDTAQTGSPPSSSGGPQTFVLWTNGFTGVTNPVWKSQVAAGVNATTVCSGTELTYDQAWITAEKHAYNTGTGNYYDVQLYGHPALTLGGSVPDSTVTSKVENRAKAKFLNKLDSVLSSVEVGQDLGEYKETVRGVTNPLKSLRHKTLSYLDSLTKAKRSFKNDKVSLAKALADSYLEWTFGWKPLALDIADGIVGLQNRSRQFDRVPISAGSKEYYSGSTTDMGTDGDGFGFLILRGTARTQCSYTVRFKGAVKVVLQGDSLPVNQVLQFDLPHFVPTAWDLLPYSFIVDYFTNVGDVIRSYSARTNQVSWCARTTRTILRTEISHRVVESGFQTPPTWITTNMRLDGANSWVQRKDFTRAPYDPAALRNIDLLLQLPNSEKPWINIGAILLSRFAHLVPLWR